MAAATVAILGALGALGYIAVSPNLRTWYDPDVDIDTDFRTMHRDFDEVGVSLGAARTGYLNVSNLNETWKPRSAPRQEPTRNISDIYRSEADSAAYVKQYAPQFYFQHQGEMPLATAVQSNPNVEVPLCTSSIAHDPGNSLLAYPRVYCDYNDGNNPHLFTGQPGTMNSSGWPTETEVLRVPREGDLNIQNNPYGPGGDLQLLFNRRARALTRRHWVDRSHVVRPAVNNYRSNKYYGSNYQ